MLLECMGIGGTVSKFYNGARGGHVEFVSINNMVNNGFDTGTLSPKNKLINFWDLYVKCHGHSAS